MKKDIHPPYQKVLFVDSSTGFKFVCGTTLRPEQTEIFEDKEYPVYYVSVSSASHPFFTGSKQFIDAEGRVDKFLKRYAQKQQQSSKQEGEQQPKEQKKPKKGANKKK
jgi:large subunit ribosomal protein L31